MAARPMLPLTLSTLSGLPALGLALAGLAAPGLYQPMTPDRLMPGTLSQDLISLAAALGLLSLAGPLARGGSARLWLVWTGLLGYLAHACGLYAFESLVNPLFLGYVATFSLAVWAIFVFFARAELRAIAPVGAPRRLTAGLFALLTLLFAGLWLATLGPAMAARVAPEGATIFVFDLALVLPALAVTATLLWRGAPWGDVLALPLLIKAATLGLSVLIGTLIAPAWGLPRVAGDVAVYAALTALPAGLVGPWWRAFAR